MGAITGQKRDDREFRFRMMSRTPSGDYELSKNNLLTHKDVLVPATKFQQDEEQKAEDIAAVGTITGQKRDHYEEYKGREGGESKTCGQHKSEID